MAIRGHHKSKKTQFIVSMCVPFMKGIWLALAPFILIIKTWTFFNLVSKLWPPSR